MDENHRKSPILHCERSERGLHFEWTKVHQKYQKWSNLVIFLKLEVWGSNSVTRQVSLSSQKVDENAKNCEFGQFLKTWGQTALPEKSHLIGKLVENANSKKNATF